MPDSRWNHNIHYHRLVLEAVPADAQTALDVGSGDGLLAADLNRIVPHVVGIDLDAGVVARSASEFPDVDFVLGDVMSHPFDRTFDVVASVATLHHLDDPRAALTRLAALTADDGVLVVIGLARGETFADHLRSLAGAVQHRWMLRTRRYWEHTAPTVWPPPHSYRELRSIVREVLPGARWRTLAMWRYVVVWRPSR